MSSTGSINDLGVAYQQYTPVLLRALGALARSGFVVPPSEALDLIHDFFVDGWPSVRTHYNRKKGPLPNYVYVSFVHYARPRIVKLNRLRSALIDPETLEKFEAPLQNSHGKLELQQWTKRSTAFRSGNGNFCNGICMEAGGRSGNWRRPPAFPAMRYENNWFVLSGK